jgi:hypothetical protein
MSWLGDDLLTIRRGGQGSDYGAVRQVGVVLAAVTEHPMDAAAQEPMPARAGGPRNDRVTLRVLGLPVQMATYAVPAVLRDEAEVSAIDVVELGTGTARFSVVELLVSAPAAAQVRARILDTLTAVYVERVSDQNAAPARCRTQVCSRLDWPGVRPTES